MTLHKYWREAYLSSMMIISLSVLTISALELTGLVGLATTAVGVFFGVLGIGMYDTWYEKIAKADKSKVRR